jgi:hypothetical protein
LKNQAKVTNIFTQKVIILPLSEPEDVSNTLLQEVAFTSETLPHHTRLNLKTLLSFLSTDYN